MINSNGKRVLNTVFKEVEKSKSFLLLRDEGDYYKCIYSSDNFGVLYGYTLEEIANIWNEEILFFEDELQKKEILKRIKMGSSTEQTLIEIRKKNGEMRKSFFCSEKVSDNQHDLIIAHFLDIGFQETLLRDFEIDEKRKFEEEIFELKQSSETENLMRGKFLANMSHEIRTPMNGIMGFLDLLSLTTLDEEQQELLKDARSATDVLLFIINDILDFSKIEAGKVVMEKVTFRMDTLIEECVGLAQTKAKEKKLEFFTDIKSQVPDELIGDPARLRQIINHLLSNAVKFTQEGEIYVLVKLVSLIKKKIVLEFEIRDSGTGIPEEYMDKLFTPFSQADPSTTRKFGGLGLGLTICREMVKMMNGDIRVESNAGKGSRFFFTVELEFEEGAAKKEYLQMEVKAVKAMIVDGNQGDRKILRRYLEEAGCMVIEEERGDGALKKLLEVSKSEAFDVVFTEDELNGMTGYDLAVSVKAMSELKNLKIIMLTSTPLRGDALKAKGKGFSGYLTKPAYREDIIKCLALVLGLDKEGKDKDAVITRYTYKENIKSNDAKVLLVEDNEMNRKMMLVMFKKWGILCDIAIDGQEALGACQKKDYEVIIMDCQMPIMDGFQSTKIIRQLEGKNKKAYIIAITADARESAHEKCLECGMDDYLTKPVDFEKLYTLLKANLKNKIQNKKVFN